MCVTARPRALSALALSGLLRVQRRWSLASLAGLETGHTGLTTAADGGHAALDGAGLDPAGSAGLDPAVPAASISPRRSPGTSRFKARPHQSCPRRSVPGCPFISRTPSGAASPSAWPRRSSRLSKYRPTRTSSNSIPIPSPFTCRPRSHRSGRSARGVSPGRGRCHAIRAYSPPSRSHRRSRAQPEKAALVTLSEVHGRRALVDLVAVGSTLLKGPPSQVGVKIADVAIELGSRRWSDLETLVLVAFDRPMPQLEGTRHAPDIAAALEEIAVRSTSRAGLTSICVIVPPWASDPADPLLGELIRLCERTTGAGVLCCASAEGALCLWELAPEATDQPTLTFGDGRRIPGPEVAELSELEVNSASSPQVQGHPGPGPGPGNQRLATAGRTHETRSEPVGRSVPIEVRGARERPGQRCPGVVPVPQATDRARRVPRHAPRRCDDRRVRHCSLAGTKGPVQTLANRLSETRRALGLASDGRPVSASREDVT